jgi:7,8-dihydroneopterin aldolase/epimerase/oxygenase
MDTIRITGLELACIVGVRPAERRRRQRVRLTIELGLDLSRAAQSSRIVHTVDYSVATDQIAALLRFREYQLIETATEEIAAMLLGIYPAAANASVCLEKPEALRGRALHGAVSIHRERRSPPSVVHGFGREQLLLETSEALLSLFTVDTGGSLQRISERPGRRLGWLVHGQLGPANALHEPSQLEHVLGATHQGAEPATVFVCAIKG